MFYGRLFVSKPDIDDYRDSASFMVDGLKAKNEELQRSSADATLVTSATGKDVNKCSHYPVIDIDVPMNLVPASRIGHTHLYINHPVPQEGLFEILDVLAKWGIVEDGYVKASKARGYSGVRLPWIKKREEIK
jgi:hypothetical protein